MHLYSFQLEHTKNCRVGRDYHPIHWLLSGSEPNNSQQMAAHELVFVVCASSLKLDGIVRGLTDHVLSCEFIVMTFPAKVLFQLEVFST